MFRPFTKPQHVAVCSAYFCFIYWCVLTQWDALPKKKECPADLPKKKSGSKQTIFHLELLG